MKIIYFIILLVLLPLVLIPLGTAEGLKQLAGQVLMELEPGQSQVYQWGITSEEDKVITVYLYSTYQGKDLLSFDNEVILEPHKLTMIDVTVNIPDDYSTDIYLEPRVHAQQRGDQAGGMIMNIEMAKRIGIAIGNPVDKISPEKSAQLEQKTIKLEPKTVEEPVKETTPAKSTFQIGSAKPTMDTEPSCGAGTELVNGVCTLIKDEPSCGAGTVEVNGKCQAIQSDDDDNFFGNIIKMIQNIFANIF